MAWKKILQYDDDEFESEDLVPLSGLLSYPALIHETQAQIKQHNPNVSCTYAEIEQWNNDVSNTNETDETEFSSETDDDDDEDVRIAEFT